MNKIIRISALLAVICTISPSFGMLRLLQSKQNNEASFESRAILERTRNSKITNDKNNEMVKTARKFAIQKLHQDKQRQFLEDLLLSIAKQDPQASLKLRETCKKLRDKLEPEKLSKAKNDIECLSKENKMGLSRGAFSYAILLDNQDALTLLYQKGNGRLLISKNKDGSLKLLSLNKPDDVSAEELEKYKHYNFHYPDQCLIANHYPDQCLIANVDQQKSPICYSYLKKLNDQNEERIKTFQLQLQGDVKYHLQNTAETRGFFATLRGMLASIGSYLR